MKEQKRKLRREILQRIKKLTHREIQAKSKAILKALSETASWKNADIIYCFMSMPGEVETEPIIQTALNQNKFVAVPRMGDGNNMNFHRISSLKANVWELHSYGIKEPKADLPILEPKNIADQNLLIIAPGLAFDRDGNRLGRGKGFYDTYINAQCNDDVDIIGIAFACQIVDTVPVSGFDCRVKAVITEEGILSHRG
ncbi:MAG: 5-formyltetrahydrofolate cyclo-ligase [Spirochaetota bacterium]